MMKVTNKTSASVFSVASILGLSFLASVPAHAFGGGHAAGHAAAHVASHASAHAEAAPVSSGHAEGVGESPAEPATGEKTDAGHDHNAAVPLPLPLPFPLIVKHGEQPPLPLDPPMSATVTEYRLPGDEKIGNPTLDEGKLLAFHGATPDFSHLKKAERSTYKVTFMGFAYDGDGDLERIDHSTSLTPAEKKDVSYPSGYTVIIGFNRIQFSENTEIDKPLGEAFRSENAKTVTLPKDGNSFILPYRKADRLYLVTYRR